MSKNLSKKELLDISREKQKLDLNIGGIRTLNGKPDLLINKEGGLCIWNDYKKIKPHKSILLMDDYLVKF